MICMHNSYSHQKLDQSRPSDSNRGSVESAVGATSSHEAFPSTVPDDLALTEALPPLPSRAVVEPDEDLVDVPMYIFLDASAVRAMIAQDGHLFRFEALLNLCAQ